MTGRSLPLALPIRSARRAPLWKRLLDITLTCAMLGAFWPLMLLIAAAVRLSSPGPVFFVQTRIGLGGEPFTMIKFRSMYADAERRRAEVAALSDREGICLKVRKDPRITPVGRLLRRSSLDELPQLFNVLAGDMSLVGPRPALPEEVALYPPEAHRRHSVLPGITGLWQVSGRADIGFSDMIDLDLDYAQRASLHCLTCLLNNQSFAQDVSGPSTWTREGLAY
jgi:lipopolysaccharide/colanic/teichoic acid biosynthesis glycosyltransferase